MGTTDSKPRTVEIPNPEPFHISRAVAERIEVIKRAEYLQEQQKLQKQQAEKVICDNCGKNIKKPTEQPTPPLFSYIPLAPGNIAGSTLSPGSILTVGTLKPTPVSTSAATKQASARANSIQQRTAHAKHTSEAEEIQFDKAIDRINKLYGNPVHWAKEYTTDIDALKHRVINCYREYRQEPLMCAGIVKQFHNYIFNKHFDAILNMKKADDGVHRHYHKVEVPPDTRKDEDVKKMES